MEYKQFKRYENLVSQMMSLPGSHNPRRAAEIISRYPPAVSPGAVAIYQTAEQAARLAASVAAMTVEVNALPDAENPPTTDDLRLLAKHFPAKAKGGPADWLKPSIYYELNNLEEFLMSQRTITVKTLSEANILKEISDRTPGGFAGRVRVRATSAVVDQGIRVCLGHMVLY